MSAVLRPLCKNVNVKKSGENMPITVSQSRNQGTFGMTKMADQLLK